MIRFIRLASSMISNIPDVYKRQVHGDVMITMDDDGQHPAEGIFDLAEKIQEGYDLSLIHI